VTIVAVPVLNRHGTISRTLVAVGLGNQLDRATSLKLARDMKSAAQDMTALMTALP
jgi:DNA-binding IclR family transcriptional regulator